MFIFALDAGHGKNTSGKRCDKTIDPNETHEWVLNSRICEKIENLLQNYDFIKTERVDDPTGETDIPPNARVNHANRIKADLYLSVHHKSGMKCSDSGGTEAYVYKKSDENSVWWQSEIYNAAVEFAGLSGDRANPLKTADYTVLRQTNMPAVQLECGYMDSRTDTPVILSDFFAENIARACAKTVVAYAAQKEDLIPDNIEPLKDQKKEIVNRKRSGWFTRMLRKDKK